MVWALIFVLSLWYPSSLALAEPVEDAIEEQPSDSDGLSDAQEVVEDEREDEGSLSDDSGDSDGFPSPSVDEPEDVELPLPSSDEPPVPSLLGAEPVRASSSYSSIYSGVAPNSAYLDWAAALLPKIGWMDDYVFFRAGQYEYVVAVGDLDWSGGVLSGSDLVLYSLVTTSGYSNDYVYSVGIGSVRLSVGDDLVYSNLGGFPVLSPLWVAMQCIVFSLCVALVCSVLRALWSWSLRTGRYVFLS